MPVIEFIDFFSEVFFIRNFNLIRIEKLMETSEELINLYYQFIFIFRSIFFRRFYSKIDCLVRAHKPFHEFNLMILVATTYNLQS